jgi:hypothetical protein
MWLDASNNFRLSEPLKTAKPPRHAHKNFDRKMFGACEKLDTPLSMMLSEDCLMQIIS